tara:strand:+ start:5910 stop:6611 length:702 start_codon:yes stop_codon:yes gene_type:complete
VTENTGIRIIDSYDKVVRKHKSLEERKITNAVCGSRHTIYSGFVFSPTLQARRQYWVGLRASDQTSSLTSADADYIQTFAHKHKMRIRVQYRPQDSNESETIQEYDLSGGEGIKYVFFDINKAGFYTVMVENLATGNCDGGKCQDGTETAGWSDAEISKCWYKKVILSFDITQEELDNLKNGEPIDDDDIITQLGDLNDDRSSGEPVDNTAEMILFGGLSLSAILLFISFLKS